MTIDPQAIAPPAYLTTLADAAAAFWGEVPRPAASAVVNALLEAESAARHQKPTYSFDRLIGDWKLWFTTGTPKADRPNGNPFRRGWYVPKFLQAQISFRPAESPSTQPVSVGTIGNQAGLGPLLLKFNGPCTYPGKKNLLAFDFTRLQLNLLGQQVFSTNLKSEPATLEEFAQQSIAKLPFFAFFAVDDRFVAARGRGGGLAIWVRSRN